jgi:hypothetical protein
MDSGTVKVGGTLDASANNGGDAGFIDTSGAHVSIDPNVKVTTLAANGKTGTWLIDPNDYKIAASGGDITGTLLSSQLGSNNIQILSSSGGTTGNGDILVNDPVSWAANTTLTLSAYRNIEVNSDISATGNTAGLVLTPGTGATGDYSLNNGAKITLPGATPSLTIAGQAYTVINDVNALQAMNNNLAGRYALGSDIDASVTNGWNGGAGFVQIGNISPANVLSPFTGVFAGNGHTVESLVINRGAESSVGLFGYTNGSLIRDVSLNKVRIHGKSIVGGVVGYHDVSGRIINTHVSGDISATSNIAGGLAGNLVAGAISNSSSDGSVIAGGQSVGGLVGSVLPSGSISNSHSSSNINAAGFAGGLVGQSDGLISDSYSNGSVSGTASTFTNVGGLVGMNAGSIINSYSTGAVTGVHIVGGLVGQNWGVVTNSYGSGLVSGSSILGGLVGQDGSPTANFGTYINSYWDTQTSGQATSAGGTGRTTSELMTQAAYSGWDFTNKWWMSEGNTRPLLRSEYSKNITNAHQLQLMALDLSASYKLANNISMAELTQASGVWNTSKGFVPVGINTGPFSGSLDGLGHIISSLAINRPTQNYVGLFGATADTSLIRNIKFQGVNITGNSYVGSLAGMNYGAITNLSSSGQISSPSIGGSDGMYVGGLIGANYSSITLSDSQGDVIGSNGVGGLVGINNRSGGNIGSITYSYSTANISGTGGNFGGLVGINDGPIDYSFAKGNVTGGDGSVYLGGLAGINWTATNNSYATGNVTAGQNSQFIAGLFGSHQNSLTTSTNTYSTGHVSTGSGSQFTGGLVGHNTGTFINGYWDTQTSGQATSAGGTGITSAQMKSAASFAAWDIASSGGSGAVWRIYEGDTAPLLRNYLTPQNVTAVAADTRVYNGTGYSGGNGYTSAGANSTEILYGGSAQGARNVGGYTIRLYSHQLGYDLSGTLSNSLTISPANLTLTTSEVTKTYDGGTSASGSPIVKAGSGTQLFSTDSLTGGSYAFTDPNAGTGNKTVTISGVTLNDGNGGNNYSISYANNTTSTIDKAPLTVTANADSKIYDGLGYTGGNGVSYSGFVNSEGSGVLGGALGYTGSSQTATNAGSYVITPQGQTSGNYSITFANGTLTVDRAALQVIASNASKTYGDTKIFTGSEFNSSGLQNSETIGSASLSSTGAAATAGVAGGPYAITPSNATGGTFNPANYNISYVNGTLTITPANLTVAADNKSREYGDANPILTATATGLRNADTSSIVTGLATTASDNSNVGSYVIDASAASAGANYTVTSTADGTLTIAPAPLTITADNKYKFQTRPNPPLTATMSGFKLGQDQSALGGSLVLNTTAKTNAAAGNYPITATGLTSTNYSISFVDGNLRVLPLTHPSIPGAPEHGYGGAVDSAHGENSNHHGEGNNGWHHGYAFGEFWHKNRDDDSDNNERNDDFAQGFVRGIRTLLSGLPVSLQGNGVNLPMVSGNRVTK